ncbi:MAG: GNAT family N-acetyltransferase [Bacteroidetes bacterium]|nr:GNAT family N-acetyltransferase [Bacteroidota bacterium]
MNNILETERLHLRPLGMHDCSFILELLNTPGWLQFIGDRNVHDKQDAEKYIQKTLDNPGYTCIVFELKETGHAIGVISFLYRENHKFPDIGFAMLPAFEKKGYAFEASRKILSEIENKKISPKVIAITLPSNKNSIQLIEKLGLRFESTFTENSEVLNLYSITFSIH